MDATEDTQHPGAPRWVKVAVAVVLVLVAVLVLSKVVGVEHEAARHGAGMHGAAA
jgi:hypothetical protein